MDYVDVFVKCNADKTASVSIWTVIFLTLARILPIVTLSPFFGSRVLPHAVKVVFSFCLVIMVVPNILLSIHHTIPYNTTFIFLVMKEVFIGTILGFFLGIPFLIVTSAGVFIDHQRGAASLMTNDPTIQNQSSPIGTLYNLVLIALFYQFDGPIIVINAVLDSYSILGPDQFFNPLFFAPQSLIKEKLIKVLQVVVALAVQLSAPGLLAILMTDTFLGIINRLAPQVQITFLGMGLKSWLAILVVCLGWFLLVGQMGKEIGTWLTDFQETVQELGYGEPLKSLPSKNAPLPPVPH